jgi:hypothetical protein
MQPCDVDDSYNGDGMVSISNPKKGSCRRSHETRSAR